MKRIKNIAFSALLAIGAFGVTTFTACNQDDCKDVVCQNGGTCAGGACSCPAGYQGNLCETQTRTVYVGEYKGTGSDNAGGTYTNWSLSFSSPGTSVSGMQLALKNAAGAVQLTFPITLTFNSSGIATYTISSTTVGAFTYTGSGTVSTSSASATVNQAGSPSLVISYNNFIRQ